MNLRERFTLLVQGNLTRVMDRVEDPETSLNQLLLEMGRQLESAKRATAEAMANEKRLRAQLSRERRTAARWQCGARRALGRGDEAGARDALRQATVANRQGDEIARLLAEQERDTAHVREQVTRLKGRVRRAGARLQLLRARVRQTAARRACGRVLQGVESTDLYGEFERLGEKVELAHASEAAYLELDDELSGEALLHRLAEAELDESVDEQLARLKGEMHGVPADETPDAEEIETALPEDHPDRSASQTG